MTTVAIYLAITLIGGLLASGLRLPPLVGFLAAGFVIGVLGVPEIPALDSFADVGVALLLFGIGLSLDVRTLVRREVWVTAVAHVSLTVVVATGFFVLLAVIGFGLVEQESFRALVLLAFAVSFSSTVFVVKTLEERSDTGSLYARTAIGILVVQDVVAVVVLVAITGEPPSPWALLLVLVVPLMWVCRRVWNAIHQDELSVLFGLAMALLPGFLFFEEVGLTGDLGALVIGMLLASHPRAGDLARSLFSVKEILLVAFFVSVGLGGLPGAEGLLVALLIMILLPFKGALFVALLWLLRLRNRSAMLTGLVLRNYSEFGIIVVAVGVQAGLLSERWVAVISIAVAASFVASSVGGLSSGPLARALAKFLPHHAPDRLHADERPIDLPRGGALVLGMGRVGRSAYAQLLDHHALDVMGIESDIVRSAELRRRGLLVEDGDATDAEFWLRLKHIADLRVVILAMPFHGSNLVAMKRLGESSFAGTTAVVTRFDSELKDVRDQGADAVLQIYEGAGAALADRAITIADLREVSARTDLDRDDGPDLPGGGYSGA